MAYVPGAVRVPTFHVQLTLPDPFAVAAPRPAAVDGPELHVTVIEHEAPAAVWACAWESVRPGWGEGLGEAIGEGEGETLGDGETLVDGSECDDDFGLALALVSL